MRSRGTRRCWPALDHAVRHAQGLRPVTTEARDLFRNPPPTPGRGRPVALRRHRDRTRPARAPRAQTAQIAAAQVPRIAMVSCNPVTFARDAAMLTAAGYRLNWVQPVDQFRWSPHVELAASLSLPPSDRRMREWALSDSISPEPGFRARLADWLERPSVRNAIIGVILFNAVIPRVRDIAHHHGGGGPADHRARSGLSHDLRDRDRAQAGRALAPASSARGGTCSILLIVGIALCASGTRPVGAARPCASCGFCASCRPFPRCAGWSRGC